MNTENPIPDISRLFIGAKNEFEVETVFAQKGAVSPDEAHDFDEILVLLDGCIELQLGDERGGADGSYPERNPGQHPTCHPRTGNADPYRHHPS